MGIAAHASVGTVTNPEGLLESAYARLNAEALAHQWRRGLVAGVAALAGPMAIGILSLHFLWFHDVRPLLMVEFSIVLAAFLVEIFGLGRHHEQWVRKRLRAEAIRREQFLLLTRVGPYLHASSDLLDHLVRTRLGALLQEGNPTTPLVMRSPSGMSWRDELEQATAASHAGGAEVMRRYLDQRIRDQRAYFEDRRASHHTRNRHVEMSARLILLVTVLVVGAKGLFEGLDATTSPFAKAALFAGALTLPALGAGVMAWRAVFEPHRLLRSYLHCSSELASVERRLEDLLAVGPNASPADQQRAFRRLVLEAEGSITEDLRRWWVIVEPEPPRI